MLIQIELTESEAEKLRSEAQRLGVNPDALAQAAVNDLLNREATDFSAAAEHVLRKQSRKGLEILDWVGKVDYYDDYDPKRLRRR